jgi:hypothetical protein
LTVEGKTEEFQGTKIRRLTLVVEERSLTVEAVLLLQELLLGQTAEPVLHLLELLLCLPQKSYRL